MDLYCDNREYQISYLLRLKINDILIGWQALPAASTIIWLETAFISAQRYYQILLHGLPYRLYRIGAGLRTCLL